MVLDLQRQAEEVCKSLEGEKTQVECESLFVSRFADFVFLVHGYQGCGLPWDTRPLRPRLCRRPTTPLNKSWKSCGLVVWTSLGPLPRWVPGPTTRWAPRTTRLALHGTCWRESQGLWRRSTQIGSCTCPTLYRGLIDVLD
jgi:hypothetical protein